MTERDDILTKQEAETLCRLYMDCRLSVFEETELRYFLSQVDYHSELIDEVRRIMEIEDDVVVKAKSKSNAKVEIHKRFRKRMVFWGCAACVALVAGVATFVFRNSSFSSSEVQPYYIAYVGGTRLSDEAARLQIEAEKKSADDFIKEMTELEADQQQLIDNFINSNDIKK